jgi:hypothetical protein
MHHANVDRYWWLWQQASTANAQAYSAYPGQTASRNDILQMGFLSRYYGNLAVSDVLDAGALCYTYGNPTMPVVTNTPNPQPTWNSPMSDGNDWGNSWGQFRRLVKRGDSQIPMHAYRIPSRGSPYNKKTPANTDTDDEYNLRYKTPLPKHVIEMNHYNETRVRKMEAITNSYIDYVNSVDGYISKCALVYHKDRHYREMTDDEYKARLKVHSMLFNNYKSKSDLQLDNLAAL